MTEGWADRSGRDVHPELFGMNISSKPEYHPFGDEKVISEIGERGLINRPDSR
jgi:hypothetical protein